MSTLSLKYKYSAENLSLKSVSVQVFRLRRYSQLKYQSLLKYVQIFFSIIPNFCNKWYNTADKIQFIKHSYFLGKTPTESKPTWVIQRHQFPLFTNIYKIDWNYTVLFVSVAFVQFCLRTGAINILSFHYLVSLRSRR